MFVDGGERHPGLNTRAVELGFTCRSHLEEQFYHFSGIPYLNTTQKEQKIWCVFDFVLLLPFVMTIHALEPKPNRLGYTCCTLRSTIKRQAFCLAIASDNQAFCQSHSLSIRSPHSMNSRMATVSPSYHLPFSHRIRLLIFHVWRASAFQVLQWSFLGRFFFWPAESFF